MILKRSSLIVLFIVITILLVTGYLTYQVTINNKTSNNPATKALAEINDGPGYTSLAGEVTKLSDYLGEIIIVNSWASWSPYSATELPALADFVNDYDGYNIKVIAINRAENPSTAERFLSTINVEDKVVLILDPEDRFYKSIGGYSMPETIIYDEEGEIIYHARGVSNPAEIRAVLESQITKDTR